MDKRKSTVRSSLEKNPSRVSTNSSPKKSSIFNLSNTSKDTKQHEELMRRVGNAEFFAEYNQDQIIDMLEWDLAKVTTSSMVADAIQGFAAVRAGEKNFQEAEKFNEAALPMLERSFGKDHAVVAGCWISVGICRLTYGKLDNTLKEWNGPSKDALAKYQQGLSYFKKAAQLYEEHYDEVDKRSKLVVAWTHIGEACLLLENADEATEAFQKALEILERVTPLEQQIWTGEDLIIELSSLAEYGLALAMGIKGEESNNFIIQKLLIVEKLLSRVNNKVMVAECNNELGILFTKEYDHETAQEHFSKVVEIRQEIFGDHEQTADAIVKQGESVYSAGNYPESFTYYQKASEMYKQKLGEKCPKYAASLSHMGLALYSSPSKVEESLEYYQRSLDTFCACLGFNHFVVGDTYNSIGSVKFAQKHTLEAMQFYDKALHIYLQNFGQDHQSVAICYNNMGALRRIENRLREASEFYRKALDIRTKLLGQDHKNTGITMNALGEVELERKQYHEAMAMFTQARFIMAKSLGPDHPTVSRITSNMGEAAHGRGQYAAAMQSFQQSLNIKRKHLGENHADVVALLRAMEATQKQLAHEVQVAEKEKEQKKKMRSESIHEKDRQKSTKDSHAVLTDGK